MGSHYSIKLGKSCHEVLNDVQSWYFCCWMIEIDIYQFFDKVNHNRLLNILRETIDDEPLLALLQQMLNQKIFFEEFSEKNIGIPRNNSLGRLLANVYLHKLDEFILKRKKKC